MKKRVLLLAPLLIACAPFFSQAPPPLEKYPARTAGKGWHELLDASRPPVEGASEASETIASVTKLAEDFTTLPRERRAESVAEWIGRNREGEFSRKSATLLQELSELAAAETLPDGTGPYLAWRVQLMMRPAAGLPPRRTWSDNDETYRLTLEEHAAKVRVDTEWLEQARAAISPALIPNFEVQRAALLMKDGCFDEARDAFKKLIESTPEHPRAEVARFMTGRCLLEQARAATRGKKKEDGEEAPLQQQAATEALRGYLQKHPQGRFVPDAHGWLAAAAADEHRYGDAVGHQLDRLASRSTRETLESVMRECDSLFVALCEDPRVESKPEQLARSLPWRAIARAPEITRIFVYQALDPASRYKLPLYGENESGDYCTLAFLNERMVRPRQFAKRGLSLLGGAMLREEGNTDTLTLTVLGWSSLRAGESAQALGLFDKALRKGHSDELLQGRAAALSACGSHARAVTAYDDLQREFPGSPLAASATFDAAIAAFKAGQAGEAILRLRHQDDGNEDTPGPGFLHPEHEDSQWLDSIAQFAPIGQIAAPLKRLPPESPEAALLRGIVRYRALAEHRFDVARRHLDPPQTAEADGDRYNHSWQEWFAMDQARWDREIEPLAAAYAKLAKQPKNAALQLETGRLWQSLRGQVTMPLHELFHFTYYEPHKVDGLRRKNGNFLGFGAKRVDTILDSHDELHHALGHFLAAAKYARDPAVAAAALEEANETLFHLYEFSPYRVARAMEEKHTELSARLVGRLKEQFPESPQAARAVAWVFREPPVPEHPRTLEDPWTDEPSWMPGRDRHWDADDALREGVVGRNAHDYKSTQWSEEEWAVYREFHKRFTTFSAEGDLPAVKTKLAALREDFAKLRKISSEEIILNHVDELDDFSSVIEAPGISADLFRRYVSMRREHAAPPPAEGEWQPLKPWLAFHDRIRPVNAANYNWRPNNSTPESWAAYLQEFPNGPKSEAASLQLIRGKVKRACPRPVVMESDFPEAPIPNGYPTIELKEATEPETLDGLPAELAAHEQRFPGGRYHADVLLLRARIATAQGNAAAALEAATAILSDPGHPELRLDSALCLSYFALRLLEPGERVAVADAFRSCPAALPFLRNLAEGETCLFRLRPLMPWLEERTNPSPESHRAPRSNTSTP